MSGIILSKSSSIIYEDRRARRIHPWLRLTARGAAQCHDHAVSGVSVGRSPSGQHLFLPPVSVATVRSLPRPWTCRTRGALFGATSSPKQRAPSRRPESDSVVRGSGPRPRPHAVCTGRRVRSRRQHDCLHHDGKGRGDAGRRSWIAADWIPYRGALDPRLQVIDKTFETSSRPVWIRRAGLRFDLRRAMDVTGDAAAAPRVADDMGAVRGWRLAGPFLSV